MNGVESKKNEENITDNFVLYIILITSLCRKI